MRKFKVGDRVIILGKSVAMEDKPILPIHYITVVDFVDFDDNTCLVDDGLYWYKFESLQLKSEYDMNNKNNTEVKLSAFNMERAKKGDLIVCDADMGVYKLTNKNCGETVHIFQFEVNGGEDQAIMSFHEESNTWFHGFMGKRYESPVFMAPVEKTGWIAIFKGPNIDNRLAITTCIYASEAEALEEFFEYESLITTKQISWME